MSLATVAAAAEVSISTVSRIVNGQTHRASRETIERVRGAIETLGYRPNQLGRALKRGESRVVAMLTANLNNPVMATVASSAEAALRAAGYVMILCDTHDRPELQDEYLKAMRSQAVQGYILVTNVKSPGLAEFVARGEPAVFACRRNPYASGAFVGIDNVGAGADAADYLWSRGCREPAVLFPAQSSSTIEDRLAGFSMRLLELGGRCSKAEAPGLSHLDVGYEAARSLLDRASLPQGVMCLSDQIAYGAHRLFFERGLRVPDDCVMVSIDGSTLSSWLAPWLTSVRVPYHEFGRHIVDLLGEIWRGEASGERILPHAFQSDVSSDFE
ncbi:LacI family DNA-binding transcriptional regulator [Telmatospirillum siberiense]|uniref:LacI family DNA-binding transcriptional regulator n=1 Tax=Telmatospirillum siberiense TaxID=382514 RepID=UPI001F53C13E|nr:LacI family DNA-binding transcriptional regulator [Telmatospirillum siberiense]